MGPSLQPENYRRNIARLVGGEQSARDHRVDLGETAVEFDADAFAQRLGGAANDFSDIRP